MIAIVHKSVHGQLRVVHGQNHAIKINNEISVGEWIEVHIVARLRRVA
jgi:hypothetical protein